MERVKWVMLNLHVWTGALDVLLTTMITPYFFFPAVCGFPVGVLAVFKVNVKLQIFIGQCSVGGIFISLIMMFENRHSSLVTSGIRIPNTTTRVIYFTVNYLYAFFFMFPAYFHEPDQLEEKLIILKTKVSCPTPEFFDAPVYVLVSDAGYLTSPLLLFLFIGETQMFFFIFQSFFHLFYLSSNLSKKTKELQKKFLIGVCIQVAVPTTILLVPTLYCVISVYFNYYNQAMTNFAVLFISLQGMTSTIVIIYINEPYRTFTIGFGFMEEYRKNVYIPLCDHSKFGYFDSWQFLATASHSMSLFLIPLNIFGSYCIIFKTPSKMERVKWVMLNLHVWTGALDVLLTTMITPYFFFPAVCGFPVGILAVFEVSVKLQIFIGQSSLAGVFISFIVLFENRHSSLVTSRIRIPNTTTRVIYFTINYLYAFFFMFPAYLKEPDQLEAKLIILKTTIPCPTPEFFDSPVYVLNLEPDFVLFLVLVFIFIGLSQVMFFVCHSFYHLFHSSSNLSNRTKELQKKFFIGVCIQVSVPIAVLLIPAICCSSSVLFNFYNQAMTNFAVLCISFHGMSATFVLLYINEPYRTFTIGLFKKRKATSSKNSIQERRKPSVFATPNEQTTVC